MRSSVVGKSARPPCCEEGRRKYDQRFMEALDRFGFYDANGHRALAFTPEVRRFLKGESESPPAVPARKWWILGRKGLGWGRGARLE